MPPRFGFGRILIAASAAVLFASPLAFGDEFVQIWRYFGGHGKDLAAHLLARKEGAGYAPYLADYLSGFGNPMPYWEGSEDVLANRKRSLVLRRGGCRELLKERLAFPLQVMRRHEILDEAGVREQLSIAGELSDDQITMIEMLVDDATVPTEALTEDAALFDRPDGTVRAMRKKAVSWVVNGQSNGKRFKAPLESAYAIDRAIYPNVFEVGKSALNEAAHVDANTLEDILPILSLEILRQVAAQGLEVEDAYVFAHSVKPLNARLYRSRYGMKVVAELSPTESILMMPLSDFIARFPPEKASPDLKKLLDLGGGRLDAERALTLVWKARAFVSQGFDTAAKALARRTNAAWTVDFFDASRFTLEVYGEGIRRHFLESELVALGVADGSAREAIIAEVLRHLGAPFGGNLNTAGKSMKEILDALPEAMRKSNVVHFANLHPEDASELPYLKPILKSFFAQIASSGVTDPVEWIREHGVLVTFARDGEAGRKFMNPVKLGAGETPAFRMADVWAAVKDLPDPVEPLVTSSENLRHRLMIPRGF